VITVEPAIGGPHDLGGAMADVSPRPGAAGPQDSGRATARLRRLAPFATGAALMLLVVLLIGTLMPKSTPVSPDDVKKSIADALASMTPAPAFSETAYATVRPSLVLIETKGGPIPSAAPGASPEPNGLGSGVVVSDAGDILTSLHVVENSSSIEVTFADGTRSAARIVTSQPENDIAVIRPSQPAANIPAAVLGGSVQVGDEVYAVGNPFGLVGSISAGVVSGLDRSFKRPNSDQVLHGLIQVDTAVNPGNSGGPLVDRDGRVVGIVAALVNPTEDDVFIGIGLAVPIQVAGGAAGLPPY
jgi:S1-C subfamily serine protease